MCASPNSIHLFASVLVVNLAVNLVEPASTVTIFPCSYCIFRHSVALFHERRKPRCNAYIKTRCVDSLNHYLDEEVAGHGHKILFSDLAYSFAIRTHN
jgi:hypothetical protein